MDIQGKRQSGNIEDRRGGGGRKAAIGGGIGTIIIALIIFFLGGDPTQVLNIGQQEVSTEQKQSIFLNFPFL